VSPHGELATGQPFTTPFEITNTGYLGVHIDNVTVVLHKIEYPKRLESTDATIGSATWDNFDLDRNMSKTLITYFATGQPEKADIILAVDYRFLGSLS
jgi:hypothetical protein